MADLFKPVVGCNGERDSPGVLNFISRYPEIIFLLPIYPVYPQYELSPYESYMQSNGFTIFDVERDPDSIRTPIHETISSTDGIREVLRATATYIGTDGARCLHDVSGAYLNITNGHRVTTDQPDNAKRTIYMFGNCFVLGAGARDQGTIASRLQQILNEQSPQDGFIVENYGHYLVNTDHDKEKIAILETLPLKAGDIVTGLGGIPLDCSHLGRRPHNFGELFIDNGHPTELCQTLMARAIFKFMEENAFFRGTLLAEPKDQSHADAVPQKEEKDYGFSPEELIKLEDYKQKLAALYAEQLGGAERDSRVGAIVMNCNPFTLGHRYLIEQCALEVDFLIVFVVREDKSIFPFEDRINLVEKGTRDIPNVRVIESGSFIISSLTFVEYFNKAQLQDRAVDTSKDVTLFAREIAPALNISVRFAGSEPFDRVTDQYNRTLAAILPKYGIVFKEIPRVERDGTAVSASRVRALMEKRDWTAIGRLVPPPTLEYLMSFQLENPEADII